jgi:predicted AlkP superfamily phosphohydrolase/phosphomutase
MDGFRPDVLRQLMDDGKLPNLKKLFVEQGTFWTGTTVFPSTTGPAYLPMTTGCYPGTCNVPGIRWVDREYFDGSWNKKGTRSYVGYESFFFNKDVSPDVKTVFEVFPNHLSIHNLANRGVSKTAEPWKLFSTLLIFAAKLSHQWKMVDDLASHLARKILRKKDITFSFITFLGVDEAAHLSSPFSPKTIESYVQVDQSVGKLLDTLQKKNSLDKTLIMASADHGLSSTTKHFELCDFVEKMGFRTFVYPKVYQTNNDAACMVSGNSMAHLYFKNGEWKKRLSYEELASRNMIAPLLEQPAIDILISKSSSGSVVISSKRGLAEISGSKGALQYQVVTKDPFGYPENLDPKNDYFDATISTDYPDGIMQAWQIMQASRAGDLIVTAAIGFDLRDRFEIPEHFSSHGSLHREHMAVPIMINRKIETSVPKRTVNIFPTILKLMGVSLKGIKLDGESFV